MTNLCIALFPTITIFWTYTVLRLVSLTRSGGRAGAAKWVDETKTFVGKGLGLKAQTKKEDPNQASVDGSVTLVDDRSVPIKETELTNLTNGNSVKAEI